MDGIFRAYARRREYGRAYLYVDVPHIRSRGRFSGAGTQQNAPRTVVLARSYLHRDNFCDRVCERFFAEACGHNRVGLQGQICAYGSYKVRLHPDMVCRRAAV